MKKSISIAAMLALLTTVPSQAAWETGKTLLQVGSGDSSGEYTWFQVSGAIANPANCSSSDIYVVRTLPRNALAILLAAKVSDTPIRLYVHDTLCDSYTGRPLVKEVGIQ